MVRRVFFTAFALFLAGMAFWSFRPAASINLFGVLFLFVAFICWFHWKDIQAGYSFLEESGGPRRDDRGLLVRLAPMHLRALVAARHRKA